MLVVVIGHPFLFAAAGQPFAAAPQGDYSNVCCKTDDLTDDYADRDLKNFVYKILIFFIFTVHFSHVV